MSKGKDDIEFRKRVKIALVKAFGGKCQRCGEEHSVGVFDFHHLNPNEKSFGLGSGSTTRAKSSYAEEAKKCVMLCANCHRYVENDGVDVSNLVCAFDEKVYYDVIDELTNKQKAIVEQRQEQREVLKAEKPLMYKPTREQLKVDIRSMPMV
jgi:NAD-dependent dihydropyrimidine dehydrogenase PreA subunit